MHWDKGSVRAKTSACTGEYTEFADLLTFPQRASNSRFHHWNNRKNPCLKLRDRCDLLNGRIQGIIVNRLCYHWVGFKSVKLLFSGSTIDLSPARHARYELADWSRLEVCRMIEVLLLRRLWTLLSSGMYRRWGWYKCTDVAEYPAASIIRAQ